MFKNLLLATVLVAPIVIGSAAQAATPTLEMKLTASSNGATSGTLIDSAHTGSLIYTGTLGGFNVVVGTGQGVGSNQPAAGDQIFLNTFTVTSAASDTLTVYLTENNLSGTSNLLKTFTSYFSATLGNATTVLDLTTYVDTTNTLFGTGAGTQASTVHYTGSTQAFSSTPSTSKLTNTLFSETIKAVFTSSTSSTSSFGTKFNLAAAVPEPSAFAPLLAGLLGLGYVARRRLFNI